MGEMVDHYEDIGGDLANYDYLMQYRADLAEIRGKRIANLQGKYVIVTDGKKGKVFLQDRRISQKHHWTKFLANAIPFKTYSSANCECKKFKFNNPRVCLIDSSLKTIVVKE